MTDVLTSSDVGAVALGKINAAFASEAGTRNQQVQALVEGLADANTHLAPLLDLQAELADLVVTVDAAATTNARRFLAALVASVQGDHPGLCPEAFTAASVGLIGATAPLDPAGVISVPLGQAYAMTGAGVIAPRTSITVDPDAIWIVQALYWRLTDVVDPNNNAVDLGIQWLDASGNAVATTLLHRDMDLRVPDGPRLLTFRVLSQVGVLPVIQPPGGAASWRPYLRTYGADGATALGRLGTRDATFAGVYAPDVVALAARVGTLEGQVSAGPSANSVQQAVLAVLRNLPNTQPSMQGQPWRNGDFVAIS